MVYLPTFNKIQNQQISKIGKMIITKLKQRK